MIYELGGKDGAEAAILFMENHAQNRESMSKLINEIQDLKVQNTTALLLAEDKNIKLH